MAAWYAAFLVSCIFSLANAQVIGWGGCQDFAVQEGFNTTQYLGTWYEIEKFPARFERGQKCIKATYDLEETGHIRVTNEGINIETGETVSIEGDAYAPDPNQAAKLKVRFFWWQPPGDYWVLHTNYSHYSVVYSCQDLFGFVRAELAWILSRDRSLDDKILAALLSDLQNIGLDIAYFQSTDQTECDNEDNEVDEDESLWIFD